MTFASNTTSRSLRPLGNTGLAVPPVIFGTSCLGNLYEVVADETKLAIVAEIIRHSPAPAVFDSAGKYGAGLALEVIGNSLRKLGVPQSQVIISNKLGWYRVPLQRTEPTFERGVWAGIQHDAESRISYEGILQCYQQGCGLLGAGYASQVVSVHDPDEFLAAAKTTAERQRRFGDVLGAYRALFELKSKGVVKAVGIGSKDWRVIREIAEDVDDAKLALAKKAGAAETINSKLENLHDKLQALTHGDGPGVVIEAVGLPATFRAAVDEVSFAGRVVYIGYAKEAVSYETKYFVMKELDIHGSRNAAMQNFADVINVLESGRYPVTETITRCVPFAEAGVALAAWAADPGRVTKIHVEL